MAELFQIVISIPTNVVDSASECDLKLMQSMKYNWLVICLEERDI